jgi:hypothetical protein
VLTYPKWNPQIDSLQLKVGDQVFGSAGMNFGANAESVFEK